MNPVSKTTTTILIIACLAGLVGWGYLWVQSSRIIDDNTSKQAALDSLQKEYTAFKNDRDVFMIERDKARDSIMQLKVEKGQVEIELNRKKTELQQVSTKYSKLREESKVTEALNICDSIVYTYVPEYMRLDSVHGERVDTLLSFTNKYIDSLDSNIDLLYNNVDSTYQIAIIDKKAEEVKRKKAEKTERKKRITAGVVGAAIGVLLTFIFGG